ncbi:unc-98 [Pristionchus pacificus]|uniref:Zinc finger protein unc-98 n=1 Tax=Pristionchus pacificus TaxID=54126 RepID=A0A2A6CEH1_PRIPA|nr:unc-98 [Pristionchus pacificus]|eukprot:PDM76645.1 unc-98 [Pristionchus pacificus]
MDGSNQQHKEDAAPPPAPPTQAAAAAPRDSTTLDTSLESDDAPTVIEKDANGFSYYPCRFCGLTFNYMNTLRAHERVHDVAQPYKCGQCGEAFHFACELEYHSQQHKDNKGYACDCGRRFFTYTEMLYHKHPEDGLTAAREIMPEIMTSPSTSAAAAAAAAVPPALQITDRDFPTPAFISEGYEPKHPMKVYSDVRSKPYICEYCSKSYPDSRQLATHMYSHRGEKTFNPRASRYMIGRQGIGYTDRPSYFLY